MKKVLPTAFLVCALAVVVNAQFNSGSTGADGTLDLSTMTCPSNICEVQLPESGILNYTTVNIPALKNLRFNRNSRNTPVTILAQGSVTINGAIDVRNGAYVPCNQPGGRCFDYRLGGPGGFAGAETGNGFGPGGGIVGGILYGRWVGPLSLFPIIGGSGGAKTCCPVTGGAGAVVIASSASITGSGEVNASQSVVNCNAVEYGSAGAIRLVANNINYTGNLQAIGNPCGTHNNSNGVIRLEANNLIFNGTSTPAPVLSPINPNIVSSAQSLLTIYSVGGYIVPSYGGTRFDTVDLLLPNQIPDPVSVAVNANNIPVGTQVNVGFVSGSPNGTSTPCTLAGTLASSSCTATISSLNRTGVTYLLATAAFAPPAPLAQYNAKGKDQVATVRLEMILGKPPKYVFLRSDNSTIDAAKVPKEFLQYFGM